MRDRLIELMNEATDKNGIYLDKVADYLLANGVIVPPCDTIWFIVDKGTKYATVMPKSMEDLPISKLGNLEKYGYYKTKEEAEQALKGNVPDIRDVEKGGAKMDGGKAE